jgi:hypothetical protein
MTIVFHFSADVRVGRSVDPVGSRGGGPRDASTHADGLGGPAELAAAVGRGGSDRRKPDSARPIGRTPYLICDRDAKWSATREIATGRVNRATPHDYPARRHRGRTGAVNPLEASEVFGRPARPARLVSGIRLLGISRDSGPALPRCYPEGDPWTRALSERGCCRISAVL